MKLTLIELKLESKDSLLARVWLGNRALHLSLAY
jgi:hypothetical protein